MPLKYKVPYVFLYFKYSFHCFISIYFNLYSPFYAYFTAILPARRKHKCMSVF